MANFRTACKASPAVMPVFHGPGKLAFGHFTVAAGHTVCGL
jgi:hypothetical protein